jgi:hypothetical protein
MNSVRAGIGAFIEAYQLSDTVDDLVFSSTEARLQRYDIFWAFYENTAYRDLHSWAAKYKADYGLYRYVRGIYNPAYRLADFWQTHLLGGALDPAAGDGEDAPNCLPIITTNAQLRPALSKLWEWSNWQTNKDIFSLWGTVLGDCGLRVVDDVKRRKVYLKVVHPATLWDVELDPFGNVKGYTIKETRADPDAADGELRTVTYTEIAAREGANVVYQTLKADQPYAWNGIAAEWSEPYGFVPLVLVQHNNVGLSWGWSELMSGYEKVREADDQASALNDQVRKMVAAQWLMAGVKDPGPIKSTPDRDALGTLYAPAGASATALVAPLDIAATAANIKELLLEIERDYCELKVDQLRLSQSVPSGRALELAQQPAEAKVHKRRVGYDAALVKAQQMACSIGALRGLPDFGFGADAYEKGALAHSIGERPIFATTEMDRLEREAAFWQGANTAKNAGGPAAFTLYLKRAGWSAKDIAEYESLKPEPPRQLTAAQAAPAEGAPAAERMPMSADMGAQS